MHLTPEATPVQYHQNPTGTSTQSSSLSSDSISSSSSDPGRVNTDFDAPTASMDFAWNIGEMSSQSARSPYGAYQQAYIPSPLRAVLTGNTARALNNQYPPMSAERHPPSPSTHATTISPEFPPPVDLASPRSHPSIDEDSSDDSDHIPPVHVGVHPQSSALSIRAPRESHSLISLVQDTDLGHVGRGTKEQLPPIAPERIRKLVEAIELAATCVRGLTEIEVPDMTDRDVVLAALGDVHRVLKNNPINRHVPLYRSLLKTARNLQQWCRDLVHDDRQWQLPHVTDILRGYVKKLNDTNASLMLDQNPNDLIEEMNSKILAHKINRAEEEAIRIAQKQKALDEKRVRQEERAEIRRMRDQLTLLKRAQKDGLDVPRPPSIVQRPSSPYDRTRPYSITSLHTRMTEGGGHRLSTHPSDPPRQEEITDEESLSSLGELLEPSPESQFDNQTPRTHSDHTVESRSRHSPVIITDGHLPLESQDSRSQSSSSSSTSTASSKPLPHRPISQSVSGISRPAEDRAPTPTPRSPSVVPASPSSQTPLLAVEVLRDPAEPENIIYIYNEAPQPPPPQQQQQQQQQQYPQTPASPPRSRRSGNVSPPPHPMSPTRSISSAKSDAIPPIRVTPSRSTTRTSVSPSMTGTERTVLKIRLGVQPQPYVQPEVQEPESPYPPQPTASMNYSTPATALANHPLAPNPSVKSSEHRSKSSSKRHHHKSKTGNGGSGSGSGSTDPELMAMFNRVANIGVSPPKVKDSVKSGGSRRQRTHASTKSGSQIPQEEEIPHYTQQEVEEEDEEEPYQPEVPMETPKTGEASLLLGLTRSATPPSIPAVMPSPQVGPYHQTPFKTRKGSKVTRSGASSSIRRSPVLARQTAGAVFSVAETEEEADGGYLASPETTSAWEKPLPPSPEYRTNEERSQQSWAPGWIDGGYHVYQSPRPEFQPPSSQAYQSPRMFVPRPTPQQQRLNIMEIFDAAPPAFEERPGGFPGEKYTYNAPPTSTPAAPTVPHARTRSVPGTGGRMHFPEKTRRQAPTVV